MIDQKILIVEDDINLGFLLLEYLESENFKVKLCRDGVSGLESYRQNNYDICILDVMLPEMDGFNLARQMKQTKDNVPFMFLTARSMKEDKLKGFAVGAEDFVTKPFDEEELLCRLKVILRRHQEQQEPAPTQFQIGDYFFDYSRQELSFLRLLCLHKNQILRRDEAVEMIYGKRDYFLGRSFDVFISKIRKLLKNDSRICIENVFKVGFILNVSQEEKS